MPVCSFVVHPKAGRTEEALAALNAMRGCEATPDDAGKVIVLVCEADSVADLQDTSDLMNRLPSVDASALCFGQIDSYATDIKRTPRGA
jgi:nitrate reductase NapAB chaperone NapD